MTWMLYVDSSVPPTLAGLNPVTFSWTGFWVGSTRVSSIGPLLSANRLRSSAHQHLLKDAACIQARPHLSMPVLVTLSEVSTSSASDVVPLLGHGRLAAWQRRPQSALRQGGLSCRQRTGVGRRVEGDGGVGEGGCGRHAGQQAAVARLKGEGAVQDCRHTASAAVRCSRAQVQLSWCSSVLCERVKGAHTRWRTGSAGTL